MDQISYEPIGLKKYLGWWSTPLLLGAVLALFALAYWYTASAWKFSRDISQVRQISVAGEGKVAIRPDVAVFSASVVNTAKKVKDAQNDNARRSNAIIDYLKNAGVAEKDIKTVNYSIAPQYQYEEYPPCVRIPCPPRKPPEVSGYEVRHTLEIKVRDLGKADDLLDGVVSNGANEVGSVAFKIDDEEKIKAEARKKAIDDAKEKAGVLARDLGVRLGRIMSFSESGGGVPIYFERAEALGGGTPKAAPAPQVAPGEKEVTVNVTLNYELR